MTLCKDALTTPSLNGLAFLKKKESVAFGRICFLQLLLLFGVVMHLFIHFAVSKPSGGEMKEEKVFFLVSLCYFVYAHSVLSLLLFLRDVVFATSLLFVGLFVFFALLVLVK